MPPRFAYWTILVGGLPTAFRAAERDELMPTFKRLQEKHADAEMRWFSRGKLWSSPEEATAETARLKAQGSRPKWDQSDRPREARDRNWRPGGAHQDPRQPYKDAKKRGNQERRQQRFDRKNDQGTRPEWKRDQGTRPKAEGPRPEWKRDQGTRPKAEGPRPEWKRDQGTKPNAYRPLPSGERGPRRELGAKPEWKRDEGTRPKGDRWPKQDQRARPAWKKDGPEGARPKWSSHKPAWKRDDGRTGDREQRPLPKAEGPRPKWNGDKPKWEARPPRPGGPPRSDRAPRPPGPRGPKR